MSDTACDCVSTDAEECAQERTWGRHDGPCDCLCHAAYPTIIVDREGNEWCDRCSPARCTCLDDDPDARKDYPSEGWATDPICFCGSSFSDHGEGSGHSPVEMYDDGIPRPPKPAPDEVF